MPRSPRINWQSCAQGVAAVITKTRLHPAVLKWVELRPRRETWAVAISGGADSLSLLLLVWALWPEQRNRLLALHFNHRLRGAEADKDERFCRRVARSLGVPF